MVITDEQPQTTLPSQELIERGVTKVSTSLPPELLLSIGELIRGIDVRPLKAEPGLYQAYDLVVPDRFESNGLRTAFVDVEQIAEYLTISFHQAFISSAFENKPHTASSDIYRLALNPTRDLRSGVTNNPEETIAELKRNAEALLADPNLLVECINRCRVIEEKLGLRATRINPSLYLLTRYSPFSTTFNDPSDDPCHRDESVEEKEVLVSIQLSQGSSIWIAGREKDRLEVFEQNQGEMVILDNFGHLCDEDDRHNPLHQVNAGPNGRQAFLMGFTKSQHQRFLDFLDVFALENGWQPTPPSQRVPYHSSMFKVGNTETIARELSMSR
jgi:hypothetical protein